MFCEGWLAGRILFPLRIPMRPQSDQCSARKSHYPPQQEGWVEVRLSGREKNKESKGYQTSPAHYHQCDSLTTPLHAPLWLVDYDFVIQFGRLRARASRLSTGHQWRGGGLYAAAVAHPSLGGRLPDVLGQAVRGLPKGLVRVRGAQQDCAGGGDGNRHRVQHLPAIQVSDLTASADTM